MSEPPQCGLPTEAFIERVIDGDTVQVRICRRPHIRLIGIDTPEIRTHDLDEKRRGQAARAFLCDLLDVDNGQKHVTLQIPAQEDDLIGTRSFGRYNGRLWLPDGREVSEVMVAAGHSKRSKRNA